ncbi:hypothetical protein [Parageobacillus thermoglucosidasius]|uniref:hypothetical protein n=1 Tax=Parageobacillus thermoglucosidasius TaxID=1426 RepID=UPI0003086182|nr:hypothetical protein [Parageobacillus thermoglucosidasius]MBY6269538.1 hypothetical protein [Parageobacillus thermoglucosidasius]OUM93905.1 MAG: hypothetical protein BAA00_22115 [Parageobacillus thermoglucosidasius]
MDYALPGLFLAEKPLQETAEEKDEQIERMPFECGCAGTKRFVREAISSMYSGGSGTKMGLPVIMLSGLPSHILILR